MVKCITGNSNDIPLIGMTLMNLITVKTTTMTTMVMEVKAAGMTVLGGTEGAIYLFIYF